jgi:PAS domain S-box-containing protein
MLDQLGQQELELAEKGLTLEQQLEHQKRIEAALRISEERWRALAENAPGTILLLSPRGEIASTSGPFGDLQVDALLGRRLSDLVAHTHRAGLDQAIAEVLRDRCLRDFEFPIYGLGQREICYSCRLGPMALDDGECSISAFLIDVSERVRTKQALREREVELRRAQKLEALGRLAAGVAHDFNNLLTVMRGGTDLLLHDARLGSDQREEVEQIQLACERAERLTRQLLAFGRQQVLAPEVLDLDQVLEDTRGMFTRLIGEDIRLEVRPNSSPWHVKLDRSQLEQILLNLAVNARDAMPHGGTLTITTRSVERDRMDQLGAGAVEPPRYVELAVRDTGVGIDDQLLERVFEPFFSTKPSGSGTGLGLAIVRGIVTQSGGQIGVESRIGEGTLFRVWFPCCEEAPARISAADSDLSDRGGERILLVEDDSQVRALVRRILASRGYQVIECKSAAEALAQTTLESIDLLLTDVVMPEVTGSELAHSIMARNPGLAVLFMSGYTQQEMVHRGMVDASVSLLKKPFTPDSLTESVRRRLEQRRLTARKPS